MIAENTSNRADRSKTFRRFQQFMWRKITWNLQCVFSPHFTCAPSFQFNLCASQKRALISHMWILLISPVPQAHHLQHASCWRRLSKWSLPATNWNMWKKLPANERDEIIPKMFSMEMRRTFRSRSHLASVNEMDWIYEWEWGATLKSGNPIRIRATTFAHSSNENDNGNEYRTWIGSNGTEHSSDAFVDWPDSS